MGYTLSIGNAKVTSGSDYNELWARWDVEGTTHPDAPVFPNDAMTGNSNMRSPCYSTWHELAQEAGLQKLFYGNDEEDGLLQHHPGCAPLTEAHHTEVLAALARWQAKATKPPGFDNIMHIYDIEKKEWISEGEVLHDSMLARLIWTEWWMRWALDNCETPAFENS